MGTFRLTIPVVTGACEGDGGPARQARLFHPKAVALDSSGNLYIADSGNHRIRVVWGGTGVIDTFVDLRALSPSLQHPTLVCVMGGRLLVGACDAERRPILLALDLAGAREDGRWKLEGLLHRHRDPRPWQRLVTMAAAPDGTLAAVNGSDWGIYRIDLGAGSATPLLLPPFPAAPDGAATFQRPLSLAYGPRGELYIADPFARAVLVLPPGGTQPRLVAGRARRQPRRADRGEPSLEYPLQLASLGHALYVYDGLAQRLWRLHPDGPRLETCLAPSRIRRISAPCRHPECASMAADERGRLYLPAYSACRVWAVDTRTGTARVFAGRGPKHVDLWEEDVHYLGWDDVD
ncbi:MAG: hypothetical protein D6729_11055 [Deltaproteobacteria bacterium]|nr:MAG: hypothetical protein D6729_11055 [Deltaproteobacteria bacterium]